MFKMLRERYILSFGSNKKKTKYSRKLGVEIGENCSFLGRVVWGSEPYLIKIGNNVKITSGVRFVTHDGGVFVLRNLKNDKSLDIFGRITIGNNVFIGIDSLILPGVEIGDNVVIGANSVVTKSLKSNAVYAGCPAKYICSIEEYYQKNEQFFLSTKELSPKEKKKLLTDGCLNFKR